MVCPLCGSEHFYVKDPEDEFETYVFTCPEGVVCYEDEVDGAPGVEGETEVFCNQCAWHGLFKELRKEG